MRTQREAIELALDALIRVNHDLTRQEKRKAIDTCIQALAELGDPEKEPEPVAWLSEGGDVSRSKRYMDEMGFICEPLYTAPLAREPLTDERIDQIIASNVMITDRNLHGAVYMAIREVEQAHGITND